MRHIVKHACTVLAAGILSLTLCAAAFGNGCPGRMAEIDQRLAGGPMLDAALLEQVITLRAEGDAKHRAGEHDAAMAALDEAIEVLDRQAAARPFRQAEPADDDIGTEAGNAFPAGP